LEGLCKVEETTISELIRRLLMDEARKNFRALLRRGGDSVRRRMKVQGPADQEPDDAPQPELVR
jgi:hypothetical protein